MPQKTAEDQAKTAQKIHTKKSNFSQSLTQNKVGFAQIPNALIDAYLKNHISEPCFKLILACLNHAETFHIKYAYLHKTCKMHKQTIKKARDEAIARNILQFDKVRDKSTQRNEIIVMPFEQWNLDLIGSEVNPSNAPNFIGSVLNGSEVNGSEVNHLNNTKPNKIKNNKTKNDDDPRAHAYDHTNKLDKKDASSSLNEVSSPPYEIVSLSKRLERFYVTKRGDPGAYDWVKANKASERLLALGNECVEKFIDHLERNYQGTKFYVSETMWTELLYGLDQSKSVELEPKYDWEETRADGIDATPF